MVDASITQRVAKLRQEINYHNHRYYVLDDPVVGDGEYDLLARELSQIEDGTPRVGNSRLAHPAGGGRSRRGL